METTMRRIVGCCLCFFGSLSLCTAAQAESASPLAVFGLVYESHVGDNWELFCARADGSGATNLTNTAGQHELYPQVSPDGTKVCFVSDKGSGRQTVRSLWVMDMDGQNRKHVADHARQPCWSPDGQTIAYLPQEYKKFNIVDYFTKGLMYYNVESGEHRAHPNSENLHHLYNPCFSANGRWIAATVHAGMGHGHAMLLIETEGPRILNLEIPGCRPCLSPHGKQIAWGADDHTISIADLDVDAREPKVGARRVHIQDKKLKIYHVDWSPDSKTLSISRGPDGKGDPHKIGTHEAACEMVGVHADHWDIMLVPVPTKGNLDLNDAPSGSFQQLTHNGQSNKESDWFPIKQ
jgi:Tol biopolymer transport system component